MGLRAARSWGERPTSFLGHSDGSGPWSARDRELAKALLLHEDMSCNGCGQPLDESLDPDRSGWYNVEPVTCSGCRAMEQHYKDHEPEPGERLRVSLDPGYVKRS